MSANQYEFVQFEDADHGPVVTSAATANLHRKEQDGELHDALGRVDLDHSMRAPLGLDLLCSPKRAGGAE